MSVTSIGGVAGRYLRVRPKRTALTILGIVLSVALVCAAGLFGEALLAKGIEAAKSAYGSFHATIQGLSATQRDQLSANVKVGASGAMAVVGAGRPDGAAVVAVIGADSGYLAGMNPRLVAGRMPARTGEIAVESWLGADSGNPAVLGATLAFDLAIVGNDGTILPSAVKRVSFTITGLLEGRGDNQAAGRTTGLVTLEAADVLRGDAQPRYDVGFIVRHGLPILQTIRDVGDAVGAPPESVKRNTALLTAMGIGETRGMAASMRRVWLILALVILLATVVVISNTFSISVLERFRQFGILRCVGATPAQLQRLVLREALILSALGIPLGVGSGILAVRVVTLVLDAIAQGFFSGLHAPLSPVVIAGSAAVGILTVILAALEPCARAGRVPPLEAVMAPERFVKERTRRRRHPLMRALFGIAGTMAAQNLTRNRRRFMVTVASMTLGVALFIIFAGFLGLVNAATANYAKDPLAREVLVVSRGLSAEQELTPEDRQAAAAISGVASLTASRELLGRLLVPEASLTAGYREYQADQGTATLRLGLVGLGPEALESLRTHVVEGAYDAGRVRDGSGAYLTRSFRWQRRSVRPLDLHVGDTVRIRDEDGARDPVTVEVLGFLDAPAYGFLLPADALMMVVDEEVLARLSGRSAWTRFDVAVADADESAGVAEKLRGGVARNRGARVEDLRETDASQKGLLLQLSILLYGLVVVISLIGALNIVNTIGASLILRTRELGMLRAVGMTDGQLRGMVGLEGVLYGLASSVPGSLVGLLVGRLLFASVNSIQEIPWSVPWVQVIGACAIAILIGVLSSLAPLRRMGRSTVVESLRGEE